MQTLKGIGAVYCDASFFVALFSKKDAKHKRALKLFKEIKYDMAYISKYSTRPGTVAAKLEDNVSQKEKDKRKKQRLKNGKKPAEKQHR